MATTDTGMTAVAALKGISMCYNASDKENVLSSSFCTAMQSVHFIIIAVCIRKDFTTKQRTGDSI